MAADAELLTPDAIRTLFSQAMSRMYQAETPQYATLLDLVAGVNVDVRRADPALDRRMVETGEAARLALERHGAIRLGAARELATIRRLFAVMGMAAVGYYDLSGAGVPVHSTAFRPVETAALQANPFRVFTSLLRLEMIADPAIRAEAAAILARRAIFTPACLALIDQAEQAGGLSASDSERFVVEALETFRWHREATVSADVYARLSRAHPLVADVVCFKGPHINHLTPRTLDIDAVQAGMAKRGLAAKAVIEGPPARTVPILLRQTSFKALKEAVDFSSTEDGPAIPGGHTARFGEVEQRGAALTPRGRALYDSLLAQTRADAAANDDDYAVVLARRFSAFPDSEEALRRQGLAYFHYAPTGVHADGAPTELEAQIALGLVTAEPIIYEDFLPVSAAGIFQSNLGDESRRDFAEHANKAAFEAALGAAVIDPDGLYAQAEAQSKAVVRTALGLRRGERAAG